MLTAEVQNILRESKLARRLVGVLQSNEGFLGFYGENPGTFNSGDYPIIGHSNEEVREILGKLRQEGLLDFTFHGCGPNVYCFNGENHVSQSKKFPGYMESRFELNPEIRVEIADFLKSEFPNEGLIQELYELQFKGRTTDRAMDGIFNLNEVAKHYAQELGVKVSTTEELRLGRGWGCYDWNNPKKWISGCMNAHIPYVILEDNDLVSFCLAAHGKKIKIMGLSYGIIGDMTKVPNEYHTNLKLMSPTNPFEDPFLKELISRYDNPVGKKFTSSVDYCTVGLRYEDPKHVLEQACQSDSNIIHRFGV